MDFNFDDIRPFREEEAGKAISDIANDPLLPAVANYLYPERSFVEQQRALLSIRTIREFQLQIMVPAIREIMRKSSSHLTFDGLERVKQRHMFIANHRDIVLDAAILDVILLENDYPSCQITFGSNLMRGDLVVNVGKMNRMFKIVRGGKPREFYENSLKVSTYMRQAITQEGDSVWIAQRNGRTKDGLDKTEVGVLKMFSLSSSRPFAENLAEINITPVAISYEYEPCDFLKTKELYISRRQKYVKSEQEDLNSILTGMKQYKGEVHLSITAPISQEELEACDRLDKNEKFEALAQLIDQRIEANRRVYKTNYIAYDLLHVSDTYASHYSKEEKNAFIEYMENGLRQLAIAEDPNELYELQHIFLSIYANCLQNIQDRNNN